MTNTINNLIELHKSIKSSMSEINWRDYLTVKTGQEEEYTCKSLMAGLNALMTDLATLINSPNRFLKISTYGERKAILQTMSSLKQGLVDKNFMTIAVNVDALKIALRPYQVRKDESWIVEFDKYLEGIQKKAVAFELLLEEFDEKHKRILELSEGAASTSESINDKKEELLKVVESVSEKLDEVTELSSQADLLVSTDKERSEKISEMYVDAKSHSDAIENFSKRVSQREGQLENQEVATNKYLEALEKYKSERGRLLVEAEKLIASAKQALQYKTAEGLSAAFTTKYNEAKDDGSTLMWIRSATLLLVAAVLIGVWVAFDPKVGTEILITRLTLIPLLIAGAWFSAGQYVKNRNIAEDYGYKSVLAKSIVGFSEQLSSETNRGEDYSNYVKTVLGEIHNDPLGRRAGCNEPVKEKDTKMSSLDELRNGIKEIKSAIETIKDLIPKP